jgi:hypothetical protein
MARVNRATQPAHVCAPIESCIAWMAPPDTRFTRSGASRGFKPRSANVAGHDMLKGSTGSN